MNRTRLLLRNLWFYRKPYLAMLAGVMISTSVLTGALIVGDSVRVSLQRLTDVRLGKIRYALQPDGRFFRQDLANEIFTATHIPVAPVIQYGGIAINSDKNLRINQVQVTGIDKRFCGFWDQPLQAPGDDEAIVSSNVAEKLGLKPGDELLLRIRKQGKAPRMLRLPRKKNFSRDAHKVTAIAEDLQMGRFSLKSNQTAPFNIFISLRQMASAMDLTGYATIILAGGNSTSRAIMPGPESALRTCWKPEDAGCTSNRQTLSGW